MASLRTLSIKENPFCEESDDWEGFVMAMLQVRINKLKVACVNPDYLSAWSGTCRTSPTSSVTGSTRRGGRRPRCATRETSSGSGTTRTRCVTI